MDAPAAQLEVFLDRYLPGIAAQGRGAIGWLRQRLPGCDALVYDNYQALAVGFSPDGKTGSVILSVALYPRWVSLFFMQGAGLSDPAALLQGSGSTIRHVRLDQADGLDRPDLLDLIEQAIQRSPRPYVPERAGELVIKSISARQKPRRPK